MKTRGAYHVIDEGSDSYAEKCGREEGSCHDMVHGHYNSEKEALYGLALFLLDRREDLRFTTKVYTRSYQKAIARYRRSLDKKEKA